MKANFYLKDRMKSINVDISIDLSDACIDKKYRGFPWSDYEYRFGEYRVYGWTPDELRQNVINFWRDHGVNVEKF